jgi:hypothetical protein
MDLRIYVENIHRQLATATESGDAEMRAFTERLVASLDAALQLTLQDALAAAAEEVTRDLAPGSVEVRLRGRELAFVVTPPPVETATGDQSEDEGDWSAPSSPVSAGAEGDVARINLRMPEQLKARVEQAAGGEGLSVNSWLVRAAAGALERNEQSRRPERRTPRGGQSYTGWAR